MRVTLNTLIFFVAALVAGTAFSQVQHVLPTDSLFYDKVDKKPSLFGSGISDPVVQEFKVEKMANGQFRYNSKTDFHIFDPYSFAITYSFPSDLQYEMKVETDKTTEDMTFGKSWKTAFMSPPRQGSRCPTDIKFENVVTPITEGTFTLNLYGKETVVKTITIKQEGIWYSPKTAACGKDKGSSTIIYAPELGVTVFTEVIAFWGSSSLESKRTLKEIKHAN